MREGALLAFVGSLLGLAGSAIAATFMKTQLFGVTPGDPVSYAIAVPAITASALLACWLPARRATRISPLEALKN
jgi:ABC-type antimicrobial peptide transport system permease subunit